MNWDATVKQDGEKTPGSHNRVTDVTNQWLYTLTQEIPAHTVELYHYKSFTITDAVDSCLSYDVKDITIKAGDKDYTDKFDITKGTITALRSQQNQMYWLLMSSMAENLVIRLLFLSL